MLSRHVFLTELGGIFNALAMVAYVRYTFDSFDGLSVWYLRRIAALFFCSWTFMLNLFLSLDVTEI